MKIFQRITLWYNLRKLKKIKPKREDATLVYTDSEGNKWYTVSPASLHATRGLTAWLLSDDIKRGLTADMLKIGFERMSKYYNEGKPSEAFKIIGVLEAALDLYATPEVLMNIATCYTFLNNEPDEYKAAYQKKKRDIWEKDFECKAFFLQYATNYTKQHSESPPSNVQEYFQEMKPVLDLINKHLK